MEPTEDIFNVLMKNENYRLITAKGSSLPLTLIYHGKACQENGNAYYQSKSQGQT